MEHLKSNENPQSAADAMNRLHNLASEHPDPEKDKIVEKLLEQWEKAQEEGNSDEVIRLIGEIEKLYDGTLGKEGASSDETGPHFITEGEDDGDKENSGNNPVEKNLPSGTRVIEGDAGEFAGKRLPLGEYLVIEGDTGNYAGMEMSGSLWIKGCTGDGVGYRMRDGILLVSKNAGEYAGSDMKGGTLNIAGEVKGFSFFAFVPQNKGTVKWKGITLWHDGKWTPRGKNMRDNNQIPITD